MYLNNIEQTLPSLLWPILWRVMIYNLIYIHFSSRLHHSKVWKSTMGYTCAKHYILQHATNFSYEKCFNISTSFVVLHNLRRDVICLIAQQ